MAADPDIVFSDPFIVLIDKPSGLLAVPGRGPDKQDCVVSRVRPHFPDLPAQPAVHRLDMQTSGLMLLARSAAVHRELVRQFEHRSVGKRYLAILERSPGSSAGIIELASRLDPDNRPHQIIDPINGKLGVTMWRTITEESLGTRVEFTPLTGRTHQLRLHAAHPLGLHAPIIGDSLYGTGRVGEKMLLHACYLAFNHPHTGHPVEFFRAPPF